MFDINDAPPGAFNRIISAVRTHAGAEGRTDPDRERARFVDTGERVDGGGSVVTIEPQPDVVGPEEITLARFCACMIYLGLDPDSVLQGAQDYREADPPSLVYMQAFINATCRNASAFDVWDFPPGYAVEFCKGVAAVFIGASTQFFNVSGRISSTTGERSPGIRRRKAEAP
jgi:hypothetical protein